MRSCTLHLLAFLDCACLYIFTLILSLLHFCCTSLLRYFYCELWLAFTCMSARTYVFFTLGATSLDLDFSNTSSSQAPLPCTAGSRHQQASSQQPAASSQAPLPWRWAPRVPWGCNVKCLGKPSHWNDVERKPKFRTMTSNRLEQQKTPSCFNI